MFDFVVHTAVVNLLFPHVHSFPFIVCDTFNE